MNQLIADIREVPDPPRRVRRGSGGRKAAEWLISGWIALGIGLLFLAAAVAVQYVSCRVFPDPAAAKVPPREAGDAVAVIYDPVKPRQNTLAFSEDFSE